MLQSDRPKRTRGYYPRRGFDLARTWAAVHGSAWLLASDMIEPPHGIFRDYLRFDMVLRSMRRCGIEPERRMIHSQLIMYRLSPELVDTLTYGGK